MDLQQVDAPSTLYHQPANLFVAGFIGSPAMNMLPVLLNRSVRIAGAEIRIGEVPGGSERATFTAAEYAADVILQLGVHEFGDQFKERSIEITKARHQFHYRGTHHFSIVGRNEGRLRGARGQRPPGIHVYPSVPTLLSYLSYRDGNEAPPPASKYE